MCRNYTEQISPAIDNRLSEELKENLFRHLNVCYQCNSEYHSLLALKNRLSISQSKSKTPDHLFQFAKNIHQQKEALSGIDPNERVEIFKAETIDNAFGNRINVLRIITGIILTFISIGYFLLFR